MNNRLSTYSSDGLVESKVTDSKLLVTECGTNVTTVEDQVTEESTATVLHEYTLVLCTRGSRHLEDDVHERCSLRNLPVDTSRCAIDLTEINDEVADGAEAEIATSRHENVN